MSETAKREVIPPSEAIKMATKVAVYGTLRRGTHMRAGALGNCKYHGEDRIKGIMGDCGSFPAIKLGGEDDVVIEVYEIDEELLYRLDRIEGYPTFYYRELVETKYGLAWVYTREIADKLKRIQSGDWCNRSQ